MSQKIIPHLWFDNQAEQAVEFYTSLFKQSKIGGVTRYTKEGFEIHGQPEGQIMTMDFELGGYKLIALNAGPIFKFTPAISFFVMCETEEEVDTMWQALSKDGLTLMPLDKYDWSAKYGWVQDRFGLSWQLSLGKLDDVNGQKIIPTLMYVGPQAGKAEQAIRFYTDIFKDSSIRGILYYQPGEPDVTGTVKHAQFLLNGEVFMAMDSSLEHAFNFTEAISLLVECDSQEEVDYFWDKLKEGGDPTAQQCGWLKDKFGVSWQISPIQLHKMIMDSNPEKVARVTRAFLQMKKFDIAALERAFEGK